MNILIFGAGAIGSFFGGMISKKENVILVSRKNHVEEIKKKGLKIYGKTNLEANLRACESIDEISEDIDLVILTVKSYDTLSACKEIKKILSKNTVVLSLQNGLDNIEKINSYFDIKNIIAGVTTNGVFFEKPGYIVHTGYGYTTIGELDGSSSKRIMKLIDVFNKSGIKTSLNSDIKKEIWIKGIVNSSINPLTTFFNCKNGHLKENKVIEKIVEKVCTESTKIACSNGIDLSVFEMIKKTNSVIIDTKDNYSSMLQSFLKNKTLEIDSINGVLIDIGKKNGVNTVFNEMLVYSLKSLLQ